MKNLGMMMEPEGNEFGNSWNTDLTDSLGDEHSLNMRPIHYFGVNGMVEFQGELHLLSEDDGHFWTHSILTEEEIAELKALVDGWISEFEFGKNCQMKLKNRRRFVWDRKHPNFPSKFTEYDRYSIGISITVKGKELAMHTSWLKDLSRVLDIN